MMKEANTQLLWTFVCECPIPDDVTDLLVDGEEALAAYKTLRDSAIFTNKRLIVKDAHGQIFEVYSLPYKSINMWSTEDSDDLDFDAEIKLWTKTGHIKINLKCDVNIIKIDKLMANVLLG